MFRLTLARLTGAVVAILIAVGVAAAEGPTPLDQYARAVLGGAGGRPSGVVRALTQDERGYIWIGTNAGMYRYDGVRLVRWETLTTPPLPSAGIGVLRATRDGSVWIGLLGGGRVMRLRGDSLVTYDSAAGVPAGAVLQILEDHEGGVWTSSRFGLSRFDGDRWLRVGATQGLPNAAVADVYEDRRHQMWVATSSGLFLRPAGGERFEPYDAAPAGVTAIIEDGAGIVWAAVRDTLQPVAGDGAATAAAISLPAEATQLLRDHRGDLWIGTAAGIVRVSGGTGSTARVLERLRKEQGLSSNLVIDLFEDREHNVWVGSQNGLTRLSESVVRSVADRMEATISEAVTGVAATADGSLWVGTDHGLYRYRGADIQRYDQRHGLPLPSVTALHTDRDGTLWVATGSQLSHLAGDRFVRSAIPPDSQIGRVYSMTSSAEGLWLVSLGGVFRWDTRALVRLDALPNVTVLSSLADQRGRLWFGLADGAVVQYSSTGVRAYSLADKGTVDRVSVIYEDRHGRIWVGANGALARLEDDHFRTFTPQQGLAADNVTSILDDSDGYLWLGANPGILRVPLKELDAVGSGATPTLRPTLYNTSDGLDGTPFRIGSNTAARAADGMMWFVTTQGLAIVDSRRAAHVSGSFPVVIEEVMADRRALSPSGPLALAPHTARLEVAYTALNFAASSKLRFRYRLDGFDSDWVDAAQRRVAVYTNLPPREYTFRVEATTDGLWRNPPATMSFSIRPAFYQTRWFAGFCILALAAAIVGTWQVRVLRLRERFAMVLAERARVGRELHDTLLQGLAALMLQINDLASSTDMPAQSMREHLRRLRQQLQREIKDARQAIWDLRSSLDETTDLATAIRGVAAQVLSSRSTRFELVSMGTAHALDTRQRLHLVRICQEALINAVRHGSPTSIRVELRYMPGSVTLRVVDDGCGFDMDAPTFNLADHWGLIGMNERAQQLGAKLRVISRKTFGTEVEIVAPVASSAGSAS